METGEGLDLKKLDGGVEFLLSLLILVLGSADSNSDESWDVSAASGPEESVQLSVNSHILSRNKVSTIKIKWPLRKTDAGMWYLRKCGIP